MNYLTSLFLMMLCSAFSSPPESQGTLILQIENIESLKGELRVALYNSESSYEEAAKPFRWEIWSPRHTGSQEIVMEEVPFGTYGIALHHDWDKDGEIDTNLLGIPQEPFGYSQNAKIKWRKAKFSEIRFELSTAEKKMTIQLHEWKNL